MPATDTRYNLQKLLRAKKLKLTWQRESILDLFLSRREPWTLKSLYQQSQSRGIVHESTVYRVLTSLTRAGILEEFKLPGKRQTNYSLMRMEQSEGHHHHIVCQVCGDVSHIHACLPEPFVGKVEKISGYRVTEHQLEFRGVCSTCGEERRKPSR